MKRGGQNERTGAATMAAAMPLAGTVPVLPGVCHRFVPPLQLFRKAGRGACRRIPPHQKGIRMKKIAYAAFASVAALALAACGNSDSADQEAAAENVEMPAEEAMNMADSAATPAADASAAASDAPAASASAAVDAATADAEKKM